MSSENICAQFLGDEKKKSPDYLSKYWILLLFLSHFFAHYLFGNHENYNGNYYKIDTFS